MATRDTYTKVHEEWKNRPDKTTPVLAEDLEHFEQGIKDAADKRALKEIYDDNSINLGRKSGTTVGNYSTAEGNNTTASYYCSHAEGRDTVASNTISHAEGDSTQSTGHASHSEGHETKAKGSYSHAEGGSTVASNSGAHAEGYGTKAVGNCSHAEGYGTIAGFEESQEFAKYGHAEGYQTKAGGTACHAEGYSTIAGINPSTNNAHAEGYFTQATGNSSHAEGCNTIASGYYQHVSGKYNIRDDYNHYAKIVGGGEGDDSRKNIHTLDWSGNGWFAGDVTTQNGASLNAIGAQESVDIDFSNYFT